MSPEELVDISIKILSKIMESISERISEKMKGMDKNDPMGAMFVMVELVSEMKLEFGKDMLPEGITDEDMENYKKEHEEEINEYLNNNKKISKRLKKLEKQLNKKLKFK